MNVPDNTPCPAYKQFVADGMWYKNTLLVQMLGLSPLLAVSSTVANALAMGIATTLVLAASNLIISLIRHHINNSIRRPLFILIVATAVTLVDLLMNAFSVEMYQILGIFIPLIVTNCIILTHTDASAEKNTPLRALVDGAITGIGFLSVLIILAAIRELLGTGALLSHMDLVFGESAKNWTIHVFPRDQNFLFALLPPGGFIILGFLVAGKNQLNRNSTVRTTGKISLEIE